MITKKNCVLLCFQSFLCTKHFVFNEGYFYSTSFPTHSRTSVENSTTFQEYLTIFQFSRTFQGSCEPWFPSFEWHWTHTLTGLDLWKMFKPCNYTPGTFWRHCFQSCVFWRNNMASTVENTSWKPLETTFPRL